MADPASEWAEPDVSGVVTEDDTPVDNIYSEKAQRLLTTPLYDSWPGPVGEDGERRSFVAMSNVGLFFHAHQPPVVPDALLSVDVILPHDLWPKQNRSYFLWQYGKPPDVVVEVVSNREGRELDDKFRIYEHVRVTHYVVLDPVRRLGDKRVRAFELRAGRYVERLDTRFEDLGLSLVEWEGAWEGKHDHWWRWADIDGAVIPSGAERAEKEAQRAEKEAQRAEKEAQRAEKEAQRAEKLSARLRALGIDPDE